MQADKEKSDGLIQQLDRAEGYLQSDPGNTDLLAMAIDLSIAAGEVERAQKHAKAALALYPDDPFFQYRWAHVLSAQRRWSEAAPVFASLMAQHQDMNLAYSLANCRIQMGEHQAAFDALQAYRNDVRLPGEAATLIVRALHHLGDFEQAGALIAQHRERLADNPAFLASSSLLRLDEGNVEEAAGLSDAALAAGDRPLEALVVNASLALARSDTGKAIERFNEVLAINPREGRSWSGLGMASLLRRDLAGAAVQLEQGVKYLPRHIGTLHALGWCKIFSQDLEAAEMVFDKALALDRNFGESHGGVAVVAALMGKRQQAESAIERASRLDRESLSARYAQMVLSGQTTDPERFKAIALRLLATRKTVFGESLAEVVGRHAVVD